MVIYAPATPSLVSLPAFSSLSSSVVRHTAYSFHITDFDTITRRGTRYNSYLNIFCLFQNMFNIQTMNALVMPPISDSTDLTDLARSTTSHTLANLVAERESRSD
jgi:hypothetical protein